MVHIILPFRQADKSKAHKRIMWLFKEYQKTGDKEQYLGEIQKIVNEIDERFFIEFKKDNKPYRVMFVPDRKKDTANIAEKQ